MAKIRQKCRDGKTVEVDAEHYDDPAHASAKLGMLVAAHGGPVQPPKPKQYTKRRVQAQPISTPVPMILGEAPDRSLQAQLSQHRAALDDLCITDIELRDVRWFFYMVISAAKWGEERHRKGGTVILCFGDADSFLARGILVDPMRNALAWADAS
jgi:hypothetical protein